MLALGCYLIYAADIVIAKMAAEASFHWPYEMGGVLQFLTVLLGSALLVTAALVREASQTDP